MDQLTIWTAGREPLCTGSLPDLDNERGLFKDCANFIYVVLHCSEATKKKLQIYLYIVKTNYINDPSRRTPLLSDINSNLSLLIPVSGKDDYYVCADPFLLCDPFGRGYSLYAECREALSSTVKFSATKEINLLPSGNNYVLNFGHDLKNAKQGPVSFEIDVTNAIRIGFSFVLSRFDANGAMAKKDFGVQTEEEAELTVPEISLAGDLQCKCFAAASYQQLHDADKLQLTFLNL